MCGLFQNFSVLVLLPGLLFAGCAHHRAVESCGESGCGSCPTTAASDADGAPGDFAGEYGSPLPRELAEQAGPAQAEEPPERLSRTASLTTEPTADTEDLR